MAPELFGPYQVQELIGRGGMGEVHRAYDTVRQRTVALKRLRPEFIGNERLRARFLRECRRAATVTEPHIIPSHDFGEIDGRLYLDMRLIEGDDLEGVLATRGPLAPDRAVDVVTQVAAALDAAHAAGLVHRDVKPSNVLLSTGNPDLHCYLADFGVAAAMGGAGSLTTTGTTVGTMDYIAPERLIGGPSDHRVDVYSLACLLHEALTGHPPFRVDELPAMIHAHLNVDPPRASEQVPTVPTGLDVVVGRGMAKDPDIRYGSAGELAAAADAALRARSPGRPAAPVTVAADLSQVVAAAAASGAPVEVPLRRRPRRRRATSWLLLVGLLLFAAGAIGSGVNLLDSVEPTQVEAEPDGSPGEDPLVPPPNGSGAAGSMPAPPSASTPDGGSPRDAPDDGIDAGGQPVAPAPSEPVPGDAANLYGGTGVEACDPDGTAAFLEAHPDRAAAWAGAQGILPSGIRSFMRTLTPVVLRTDTAVTDHGFRNGRAEAFQSVMQAGTTVLVDQRGVPRVRCAYGNPLDSPAAGPLSRYEGATWSGLRSDRVTAVRPAPSHVTEVAPVGVR